MGRVRAILCENSARIRGAEHAVHARSARRNRPGNYTIVAQAVQKGEPGPKIAGNLANVGYLQRSRNLRDVG
jgi:hypothetical protein